MNACQSFCLFLHQISHAAGSARRRIPHGSTYSLALQRPCVFLCSSFDGTCAGIDVMHGGEGTEGQTLPPLPTMAVVGAAKIRPIHAPPDLVAPRAPSRCRGRATSMLKCRRCRGYAVRRGKRGAEVGAAGRGEKGESARSQGGLPVRGGSGGFLKNCEGPLETTTCF